MISDQLLSELAASSPLLVLGVGSLLLLLLEAFLPKWPRVEVTAAIFIAALALLAFNVGAYSDDRVIFHGMLYADRLTYFLSLLILTGGFLALMAGAGRLHEEGIEHGSEYYTLMVVATFGAIVFVSAAEFITLFLGLEVMSLALYPLCGSSLMQRRSSESALKYFLLGSFSSAFLLYGIALLYGLTGTTEIAAVATRIQDVEGGMLLAAVGLMLVGLAFKVGAAPFHFWTPDVYEGAPTSVTAYMACVIKAAAVAVLLRVLWSTFGELTPLWSGAVSYLAVLSMTIGNLAALRQRSLKRLLAYSSIAHAGYMCVGLLARAGQYGGGAAILYYLVSYTAMTMGAFAVVMAVSGEKSSEPHSDDLSRFYGLGSRRPLLAAVMTLFMLSLAGIPPGMAGLLGKVYIFSAAVKAEYVYVAVIGVINSAISAYYYLSVIVAMYFRDPVTEEKAPSEIGVPMAGVLGLCSLAVLVIGLFPSRLIESAQQVVVHLTK